jgi:hypothetical protein
LNRTRQIQVHQNINTVNRNIKSINDTGKEVGLEANGEKTKYTLMSRHQNAGQNHDMKIANRLFENMAQLKYLGMTVNKSKID